MKKTALFLFMLFVFVMKAQEIPETVLLGEIPDKKIKYYIYPKTIKESERPGYITAWLLEEYSVPKKSPNGKYYMKTKTQYLINCKYNKVGVITILFYSKDNTHIYSTESTNEYLVKEESMPPGSIGEDMIKASCYIYDKILNQSHE
ncbi:MAG: hypothetical protein HG427_002950 [Flavobacteriaceae bacterium]|nr:hypothetical protein [Flavobacteriaceae bacterium]